MNSKFFVIRSKAGSDALHHLKVRRNYSKWGFYLMPRYAALSIHTDKKTVLRSYIDYLSERCNVDGEYNTRQRALEVKDFCRE